MRVSEEGREFIKRLEGLVLNIYRDVAGFASVGWGHLVRPDDDFGVVITREDAERLFDDDIAIAEASVNSAVEVDLAQHQYDAVTSFCYNLGGRSLRRSTLLKKLNQGDFDGAAREFHRWVYAGDQNGDGVVTYEDRVKGLVIRRQKEEALFRDGVYG